MTELIKEASAFSVLNTEIEMYEVRGRKVLQKLVRMNVDLPCSLDQLKGFIDRYLDELLAAALPVPVIVESFIEEQGLVYVCEHAGANLAQLYRNVDALLRQENVFNDVLRLLRIAQLNEVAIDPHPKNFVYDGRNVSLVDFSPPYNIDEYKAMRLQIARDEERSLISTNFAAFEPDSLGYHFLGDFLNLGWNLDALRKMYPYLMDFGLVQEDSKAGLEKARFIRRIEDERLARNIYLM